MPYITDVSTSAEHQANAVYTLHIECINIIERNSADAVYTTCFSCDSAAYIQVFHG